MPNKKPQQLQNSINQELNLRVERLQNELNQTQSELMQAISQRNALFLQLQQYSHLRSQTKMLLVNIRKAYRREFEKLNQSTKLKRVIHMRSNVSRDDSQERLSAASYAYDKKALRESRIINGRFRRSLYVVLDNFDTYGIRLLKVCLRLFRKVIQGVRSLLGRVR